MNNLHLSEGVGLAQLLLEPHLYFHLNFFASSPPSLIPTAAVFAERLLVLNATSPYDFSKTITIKYKVAGVTIQGKG